MKKILLLLLCLLFAFPAWGEESRALSTDGYDQLTWECALPDSRMVLCGTAATKGNYQDSRARLLCLNPDGTIAWEYLDPTQGTCKFANVQLLENNELGVIFTNSPNQKTRAVEIRRFTLEGQPVGEAIDIFRENISGFECTDKVISYAIIPPDAQVFYRYYIDWQGNILFRLKSNDFTGSGADMLPAEQGVVLYGSQPGYPAHANIIKLDMYGNLLWETVLPTYLEGGTAAMEPCIRLQDGSYLGVVRENNTNLIYDGFYENWHYDLVRLDEQGNILWQNHDAMKNYHQRCEDIIEYDGKLVLAMGAEDYEKESPYRYLWFTLEGEFLGETRLPMNVYKVGNRLMELDGVLYDRVSTRSLNDDNLLSEMDSVDEVLYRVPLL